MIFRTFPATRTAAAQAAVALLCGAAAHAQTTEAALPAVTISADPAQQSATEPVRGFVARRALSATKTDTPLSETPQAITVILYPLQEFREVTQAPENVAGLYDGKIRVPLGGLQRVDDAARRLLVHELTHAFVHSKTRGNCPTWRRSGCRSGAAD